MRSPEKLFGGWIRSRATVGDASKGRSNEPCSGSYRASAAGFLSEIHKGVGLRQSAKQLLEADIEAVMTLDRFDLR